MRLVLKMIGLILLVPALGLSLAPLLATHTHVLDNVPSFSLMLFDRSIFDLRHTLDGTAAVTSKLVWLVAALGELILIAVQLFMPRTPNPHKLSIRH